MNSARDPHLLSGAYAVHAVTGQEATEVEAAMLHSEELCGEIAELTDTAVLLGLSVPPEVPPAVLRSRLLALLAATPQLDTRPLVEATPASRAPSPAEERATALPAGSHLAPARRSRLRRRSVLLAIAAVAVLLFGGGLLVDRVVQAPAAQSQNEAFAQLTSAPDAHRSEAAVAGGGSATVYWSDRLHASAVVLNGVEHPTGRSLQIWRLTATSAVSAGLYQPVAGERYRMLQGSFTSHQALAVTIEPPGGSRRPTTKPIVVIPTAA